jgi:hypothetical protein
VEEVVVCTEVTTLPVNWRVSVKPQATMTTTANLWAQISTQDLPDTERESQPLDNNAIPLGSVMVVSLAVAQEISTVFPGP